MHYNFHTTPTHTFRGRTQTVTSSNQYSAMPGPADYIIKKPLPSHGTVSPTKEQRVLFKPAEATPEPGKYPAKSFITQGPKLSISARTTDYVKRTPGPFEYFANASAIKRHEPAFSLGAKSKSMQRIVQDHNLYKPAPTAYEDKGSFAKTHGPFFGSSKRTELTETEKTPAPNVYNFDNASTYAARTNPRCKIGTEPRNPDFAIDNQSPGPGRYDKKTFVDTNEAKKKGFSCRNKTADLIAAELSKVPGPGHYQPTSSHHKKAPRCSASQAKRKTFMDDMQATNPQFPAPGAHNSPFAGTKYQNALSYNFGNSKRRSLDEYERTPGPAVYHPEKLRTMASAPKFSSTKAIDRNEFLGVKPVTPGPGHYDGSLALVKSKTQVYEVSHELRPGYQKHRFLPGPGSYQLNVNSSGPDWKFKTEKRLAFTDRPNEAKGGVDYDIPSMIANPPKYMHVEPKVKYEQRMKTHSDSKSTLKTNT